MKKTFLLILMSVVLFACGNGNGTAQNDKKNDNHQPSIVAMVDTFILNHSGWTNNDITRKKANTEWKQLILDSVKNNPHFLDQTPVLLQEINLNKKGKYIAHFIGSSNNLNRYPNIRNLDMHILMEVPDSLISQLIERQLYVFTGPVIKVLNSDMMKNIYGRAIFVSIIEYELRPLRDNPDQVDVYLTNFLVQMESIALYSNKR